RENSHSQGAVSQATAAVEQDRRISRKRTSSPAAHDFRNWSSAAVAWKVTLVRFAPQSRRERRVNAAYVSDCETQSNVSATQSCRGIPQRPKTALPFL